MATQFFLVRDTAGLPGIHRGTNSAKRNGTASGWASRLLSLARGDGSATLDTNTVTGPTSGVEVVTGTIPIEWVSLPLAAAVTISGTITLNLYAFENNMSANVAINAVIDRLDSTGAVASTIATTARVTEMGLVLGVAENFTVTPTSTSMLKGDRIRVRVFGGDAGAMATGFTFRLTYNRPSAAADGDSWIQFNETITVQTTVPTGSQLFLTDTDSGVLATAVLDREMWTARGSGAVTGITNTFTGWAAPAQWTSTAGGNALEWYSKALTGFTLDGLVRLNLPIASSNLSANAGIRAELAICNGDGSGATVWGANSIVTTTTPGGVQGSATDADGEIAASGETPAFAWLAGAATAVTTGQRLRFRLYVDDTADEACVSGQTVTVWYGGTSGGATGDAWIQLPQTVTASGPSTQTVTAQIASLNISELQGTVTVGAVTVTAQLATLATTAIAGSVSVVAAATTVTAQIATLSLRPGHASHVGTDGWLNLTGSGGATTPDHASLNVTGDLEMVMRFVYRDDGDDIYPRIIGKGTNSNYEWFYWHDGIGLAWLDGAAAWKVELNYTRLSTIVDFGDTIWLKVVLDVNDGAGNYQVSHWYAADQPNEPTSWTQFGYVNLVPGPTSITPTASTLVIGNRSAGDTPMTGHVLRAIVRNGIGGTAVLDIDYTVASAGSTWTDRTGKVLTNGGTSTIVPGPLQAPVVAQLDAITLTALAGVVTAGPVTVAAQIASLNVSELQGVITTGAITVTAQIASLNVSELQGVVTVGAVTVTAQLASLTLTTTQGALTVGPTTVAAQLAIAALTALPGVAGNAGGATQTVVAQRATLTLTTASAASAGPVTVVAQLDTLTLTAQPGSITTTAVTVVAQIASLNVSELSGTVTVGAVTVAAQIASLNVSELSGVISVGSVTVVAQQATLALSPQPGSISVVGGAVQTVIAQVANLALSELQGVITVGPSTRAAQLATLALTGLPGTVSTVGGVTQTVVAQVATLTVVGLAGVRSTGPATVAAQRATLTLTAAGTRSTGPVQVDAQLATIVLVALGVASPGRVTLTAQLAVLALVGVPGRATGGEGIAAASAIYVGTLPATRVYAGTVPVWP